MGDIKPLIRNIAICILVSIVIVLAGTVAYAVIYFIFVSCPFFLIIILIGAVAGAVCT